VRAASMFILFAILVSIASASTLAVKVTVTQDTLAVGTNVSVMTGGVVLEEKKAGSDGYARFNLSDGSYFVQLRRYPYPLHVSLVEVKGNTEITLTMRQLISYASAYGQIFGPSDFSNASVSAYQNGLIVKRAAPNAHGFYLMSFLPEGEYELEFIAPGFVTMKEKTYLLAADFIELSPTLEKFKEEEEHLPVLSAPGSVKQFSIIEVSITKGLAPLSGEKISVETPSGKAEINTGSDGKARINAAEAGTYKFTYQSQTVVTAAVGKEQEEEPEPVAPELQPAQPPVQGPGQQDSGGGALLFVVLAFLSVVGVAAIAIAAISYLRGKKKHRK